MVARFLRDDSPQEPSVEGEPPRPSPHYDAGMSEASGGRAAAVHVVRTLQGLGFEAYLVGGCVRDELRGVEPREYDVATSAHPEQVEAAFPRTVAVGRAFGVVVVVDQRETTEVATFRSDGAYVDGRRPETVEYGSVEEDAARRDFTVNALYLDPVTGEVTDHVGGRADLARGLLRAIGDPDARFREDHLRLLRAVRFGATGPFEIEEETWAAVARQAPRIRSVARERVGVEVERTLTSVHARRGIELLAESGLGDHVLPGVDLDSVTGAFEDGEALDPVEAWATLLRHSTGADASARVRELRRPGDVAEKVGATVDAIGRLPAQAAAADGAVHAYVLADAGRRALRIARRVAGEYPESALERLERALADLRARPLPAAPLLPARELLRHGYAPGPALGKLLAEVEDRRLDRRLATPEEALRWLLEHRPPNAPDAGADG